MAILNSDRFGLAALHQLRGRVGRNPNIIEIGKFFFDKLLIQHLCRKDFQALAVLNQRTYDIRLLSERLNALQDNADGLKIAEIDADMRGYGDFLGVNQSGGSGKIGVFINKRVIEECKTIADKRTDL